MGQTVFYAVALILGTAVLWFMVWPVRSLLLFPSAKVKRGVHLLTESVYAERLENYFVKCIEDTREFIKIVAGECTPDAFTEKVGDALRKAIEERCVVVEMACGPILLVRDDGYSPILSLAKEGKLKVYFSEKRQEVHFRVADRSRHAYWEKPHRLGAERREYFDSKNNSLENGYLLKKFDKLISSGKLRLSQSPETDFLIVKRHSELPRLKKLVQQQGKEVEHMDKDELRPLIEQVRMEEAGN